MRLSVDTSLAKLTCSSPLTRKRNDWIYILNSSLCELLCKWASLVAQTVKNLSSMQGTWVRSLGQEDPLENEMATPSSILAWRIPRTEEPGGLQFTGSPRVAHDWATNTFRLGECSLDPFSGIFEMHCVYFLWFPSPPEMLISRMVIYSRWFV